MTKYEIKEYTEPVDDPIIEPPPPKEPEPIDLGVIK
jgi:hypothetical protein